MNGQNYDPYLNLALAAFFDGLNHAVKELVTYKLKEAELAKAIRQKKKRPTQPYMGPDLMWVMSNTQEIRGFIWYCHLFNVDPNRIRNVLREAAHDFIYHDKPLPKYRETS